MTRKLFMRTLRFVSRLLAAAALALLAAGPAQASKPGCVGKMWNPLGDLDFRLMGGIKIGPFPLMKAPTLGEPPAHDVNAACFCKDGLNTGWGFSMTFWMPSYINDVARQGGCLGFLAGTNILPAFVSLSSAQEYSTHTRRSENTTSMQIHWAYADVTAIAGKALFEKCNAVTGSLDIAYMTEVDFVYNNDVYSAIMAPQNAILAAVPMLAQMTCGVESMANTLGDWQDSGLCAWAGTRFPLSGNSIGKTSAQVTNMDVTVKYLARAALMGVTKKTMGDDVVCQPKYSMTYDPFQHRYQWAFPGKVSTRFNVDMLKWGVFIKDNGQPNILDLNSEAAQLGGINSTIQVGANYTPPSGPTAPGQVASTPPSVVNLSTANSIVAQLPKPLHYPTREAGFMQVWEARQCCMKVLTIQNVIEMLAENLLTAGNAQLAQLYDYYKTANAVYQVVQDPVGAVLSWVGSGIAKGVGSMSSAAVDGITNSLTSLTQ